MLRTFLFTLPFVFSSFTASAADLSAVYCSEYSVSMTFDADITDAGQDVTKAGLGTNASGPFTAFSSSSTISVEGARNVTISLSDDDVINLGEIAGGSSCVLEVNSGFLSGVSGTSTVAE